LEIGVGPDFNSMCSDYTYNKDEAKLRLRDRILVYGACRAPISAPLTSPGHPAY